MRTSIQSLLAAAALTLTSGAIAQPHYGAAPIYGPAPYGPTPYRPAPGAWNGNAWGPVVANDTPAHRALNRRVELNRLPTE